MIWTIVKLIKILLRFHLKKGGTTNVQTLLQKMFQAELRREQEVQGGSRGEQEEQTTFDSFN